MSVPGLGALDRKLGNSSDQTLTRLLLGIAGVLVVVALFFGTAIKAAVAAWVVLP